MSERPFTPLRLLPHPSSPALGISSLEVGLRRDGGQLRMHWSLKADMQRLLLPAPGPARQADRLWEHSCFELFAAELPAYREFNVSPDGAWAVYDFRDYRQAADTAVPVPDPGLVVTQDYRPLHWQLDVSLALAALPARTRRIGLSAVLESIDGERAYWALAHPGPEPDFHAAAAFVVDWPA